MSKIVAVALLTQEEVDALGKTFARLWPVDETPCFDGLLRAIDEADTTDAVTMMAASVAAAAGRPCSS